MTRTTRAALMLSVLLLLVGCTRVTTGRVEPASGLMPTPLTGQAVKKVLPDADQLAEVFSGDFKPDDSYLGGTDELTTFSSGDTADCIGVAEFVREETYADSDVINVAKQTSWYEGDYGDSAVVMEVQAGVVALKTATDAAELFTGLIDRWQQCDGKTAHGSYTYKISDVQEENSVLYARTQGDYLETRALGVRVNCLVDLEVTYFTSEKSAWSSETGTVDLAHAMMDKVSELS